MNDIDRKQELKDDVVLWAFFALMIGLAWLVGAWPPEVSF